MAGEAPTADTTTVAAMIEWIRRYTAERDWEKFHNPKDLGVALAIEMGEVLEHFRFRTNEEIAAKLAEPEFHREFGFELADCLWMLLRLADVAGVDLAAALAKKMDLAAAKYPADVVRGKPHKYTHYQKGRERG
jgi:dCTP diphosphatase